jgi:type IV pilus assembly protein PilO
LVNDPDEEPIAEQGKELQLKDDYKKKTNYTSTLEALTEETVRQVQQYVTQLEKQLPSKAEMTHCCLI